MHIWDNHTYMSSSATSLSCYKNGALSAETIIPSKMEEDEDYRGLEKSAGPFHLKIHPTHSISYCDFKDKKIVLSPALFRNRVGAIYPHAIQALVFEMANLAQSGSFDRLADRVKELTPDEFVENSERLEHRSAVKTKEILRKNFPISMWDHMPIVYSHEQFGPHYLLQQASGHSKNIWERYRPLMKEGDGYKGTWATPVQSDELPIVKSLLHCASLMDDSELTLRNDAQRLYNKSTRSITSKAESNGAELYSRLAGRIKEIESSLNQSK